MNITYTTGCGCGGNQGYYSTNMWNKNGFGPNLPGSCGHQQSCNGCLDIIKTECIVYTGSNLVNTGINKNDTLSVILQKLDAIKLLQDTKNNNLLAAINDINDRVNVLEGGTPHAPYTLL